MIKSYWLKVGLVHFQNKKSAFCAVLELTPTTLDSVQTFPGNVCTESAEIQVWELHLSKITNLATLCRHFLEMSAQSQYSQTPILCAHFLGLSAQNLKKKFKLIFRVGSISESQQASQQAS